MHRKENPFATASDYTTPLQPEAQRQHTSSAQSEFYNRQNVSLTNPSGSYSSSNSCPVAGEYPASGHMSPLEMIDQIDDDERLLQALEGLTLDSNVLDGETDPSLNAKAESASTANAEKFEEEPRAEHGTRSEFIKNVSETLISRVNGEASNIEEAKQLMHQYMLEFCAEYDRCGYGQKPRNSRLKIDSTAAQSDNLSASASTVASRSGAEQKQSQGQMVFDNQILKKGVRVLSKNL